MWNGPWAGWWVYVVLDALEYYLSMGFAWKYRIVPWIWKCSLHALSLLILPWVWSLIWYNLGLHESLVLHKRGFCLVFAWTLLSEDSSLPKMNEDLPWWTLFLIVILTTWILLFWQNWAETFLICRGKAIGRVVILGSCVGPLAYLIIPFDLALVVLSSFSQVYLPRLIFTLTTLFNSFIFLFALISCY